MTTLTQNKLHTYSLKI